VKPDEIRKLETYLKTLLKSPVITVRALPRKNDSAEVYVGDEFVGTITRDEDDGELCYQFQMAILDMDLDDA
jgi:hypothetical protein